VGTGGGVATVALLMVLPNAAAAPVIPDVGFLTDDS
jgi:hypothetical protein